MATRSTAARKTASKGVPARKAAAAPRSRKPPQAGAALPATAESAGDASLADLLARLGKLELAGLAGRLVQGWRADIEVILQANRKSLEGLQSLVEQQMARIKAHLGEVQSVAKLVTVLGPKESARHVDDLARASVELALDEVRQLAAAAAQSQKEAFDLVQQRVTANIEEVQRLLRK